MKLHEYQAKEIFKNFGIPAPEGILITKADDVPGALNSIKGPPWVIKAQIHAGGRGKAGGVRIVNTLKEAVSAVKDIFGRPLVTKQTGPEGREVNQVLIEERVAIDRELFIAITIDREHARPVIVFSQTGGVDIEDTAERAPERVLSEYICPAVGWSAFHGRNLVYSLDPVPMHENIMEIMAVLENIYNLFVNHDCSLVEINPLVITKKGEVIALDAKMEVDDNALFRQKEMMKLEDEREKEPVEVEAARYHLNYIRLEGNVGAMVNGAGLAMATMDAIKMAGAEPANFLDVGGGADEEMIEKGFTILLDDKKVKAILINIFGGILRCDVLARGVLSAIDKHEVKVPLIIRLEGTNAEQGRNKLKESGLEFMMARDMTEAAELVKRHVRSG